MLVWNLFGMSCLLFLPVFSYCYEFFGIGGIAPQPHRKGRNPPKAQHLVLQILQPQSMSYMRPYKLTRSTFKNRPSPVTGAIPLDMRNLKLHPLAHFSAKTHLLKKSLHWKGSVTLRIAKSREMETPTFEKSKGEQIGNCCALFAFEFLYSAC